MAIYPYSFTLPPVNKQDIPSNGVPGEFLGISAGGVLDWLPVAGGGGGGDMLKSENLSGLADYAIARTNIGLGTASTPTFANLTLTSPSLSSSAPVTISQTWNNAAINFNELFVRATDTASGASSNLLYIERITSVGAVKPLLFLNKLGVLSLSASTEAGGIDFNTFGFLSAFNWQMRNTNGYIGLGATATEADTRLYRDTNNTLALRNGAAAQTFRVYGAYPDTGINYARLALSCDTSGNATISTQALGTYTAGTVSINGVPVGLGKGNVSTSVAVGTQSINVNPSNAPYNTAIGYQALLNTQAGDANGQNTAVGALTLSNGIGSGSFNSAFGALALLSNYGTDNTAVGSNALRENSTGTKNTALGKNAGYKIAGGVSNNFNGANSLFLGVDTKALDVGQTNQIVIGYDATGIGSNSVVLGNDSITKTALKGNVGIGTTAPLAKLQVNTNNNGLNIVTVFYNENNTPTGGNAVGFAFMNESGNLTHYKASIVHERTSTWARGKLHFLLNNTEGGFQTTLADARMTIQPDGNVGIGTTSPTSKLHVAGDVTLPNGGSIFFGGGFNIYGTTTSTTINGPTAFGILNVASNGVTKWTFNYDGLLCGGGTTAAFPALKRSSTTMQARLADDTAFAPIQGKLTTDTAFTATTVTPTGFITLYDSTGTAYKVPCVQA